jgi:hypothetical protein
MSENFKYLWLALTRGASPPSPYGHTYDTSGKDLGDTFPGRWTDGQNWVDYFPLPLVANHFDSITPFYAPQTRGTNVAVAGSTSADLLQSEVPAVTQNQPLKVEIKGVKTSHFSEQKTAPRNSPDAGSMEHVELPKSELANNDLQFRRPRLVPTTDRTRAWDRSRDRRPIFAVSRNSHFDHRA